MAVQPSKGKSALNHHDPFEGRGHFYNSASEFSPLARKTERDLLMELLPLEPGQLVCDALAGGGYLAQGIDKKTRGQVRLICIEPSKSFAQGIALKYRPVIGPVEQMPFHDLSMDQVGSLAELHHVAKKAAFFKEVFRILKPGGRFAVGDVLLGSTVAGFLNDAVDRFTETGHHGMFVRAGELTSLLAQAGFTNIREKYRQFYWPFPDSNTLVKFCHLLFGMVKADLPQVEAELKKYFAIEVTPNSAKLPWSLVYAVGTKRD